MVARNPNNLFAPSYARIVEDIEIYIDGGATLATKQTQVRLWKPSSKLLVQKQQSWQ